MIVAEVKYKKTGNEWVPEIPEHWEILKAKNIGYFEGSTVDKKIVKHDKLVRIVNFLDIYNNETFEITEDVDFMKVSATEHQIKNLKVNVGDVVFTPSSEVREDIGKSAVIKYSADDLLFSYHVSRLKFTREIDINFKKYLFNNKPALKHFSKNCKGSTRKILNRIDFKNLPVYLPPINEQIIIANFLDAKSNQITHFIQTKQRFIELLKEQRQSIITNAVIKGIDEKAKLKETVLGEIPEHWEVRRLKTLVEMKSGENITAENIYQTGEYPVYGGNGLRGFTRTFTNKGNFVLIGRQGALCGNINYAFGKFYASEHAVVVYPKVDLDYFWLGETLRMMNLNQYSMAAAQPGLAINNIRVLPIPYPPLKEQKRIVEHIKTETHTLDLAISKAEREIELIKEYREAMIAEAVAGKMKL